MKQHFETGNHHDEFERWRLSVFNLFGFFPTKLTRQNLSLRDPFTPQPSQHGFEWSLFPQSSSLRPLNRVVSIQSKDYHSPLQSDPRFNTPAAPNLRPLPIYDDHMYDEVHEHHGHNQGDGDEGFQNEDGHENGDPISLIPSFTTAGKQHPYPHPPPSQEHNQHLSFNYSTDNRHHPVDHEHFRELNGFSIPNDAIHHFLSHHSPSASTHKNKSNHRRHQVHSHH